MASLSSQRDSTDDPWQDIVYNVIVNDEMLDLIAEEDNSDNEEKTLALTDVPTKKRARLGQFGPESSKRSFFYSQYIVKDDKCIDRTSTVCIWNPLSSLGLVFRNRFRVPCLPSL